MSDMIPEPKNALALPKEQALIAMLKSEEGPPTLIAQIRAKALDMIKGLDPAVAADREKIKSAAYAVSRTKETIDKQALAVTEQQRKEVKAVNAGRAIFKEELSALRDEIRKPADEWEKREQDRKDALQARLDSSFRSIEIPSSSAEISALRDRIRAIPLDEETWQEQIFAATIAREEADERLTAALAAAVRQEERDAEIERQRLELEELRAEKARREEADRLAAEAEAERKRQEEEAAAEEARKRLAEEKAEADRKAAAEKAEADRIEAERKAEEERKAAEERAERERQAEIERATEQRRDLSKRLIERCRDAESGVINGRREPFPVLIHDLESRTAIDAHACGEFRPAVDEFRLATLERVKAQFEEHKKEEARKAEEERQRVADKAAQEERDRVAAAEERQRLADEARAKDEAHRARIRSAILEAIEKILPADAYSATNAGVITDALIAGQIPHCEVKL